ncbi:sulfotransferase family protein [Rhodovulum bhavnagarense]|uniref:Sulfotransferase family protein n=1 Tax=Rhodovulum bhavnagarense TaxID=992286 RepID=A0A4R2RMB9_9RHOB|nr:sulfotransferase [Rhodovulum bhavnagarense]TCP63417.1 sulfotransferase family protein [Rhodovulum bhavnagarense]
MMDAPSVPDPVFVLAAPRSFTSLITAMIGQHPELYGLPELNLFQCDLMEEFNTGLTPDGISKSPVWKTMRHGLLRTVAELYAGEQTVESIHMAERWLARRADRTSAEVFHELCKSIAPLRVVEKSPGVLRKQVFMDRMLEAFPNARFIHLLRSPVDQGRSVLKAKGGIGVLLAMNCVDYRGEEAALEPQILWHDTQVQILRFLDKLPDEQFVTVRGEDLLNDLDNSLGALCRWLGVSDDVEAIAAMKRPEESAYSCLGPANARLGNDVNFLRSPALREGGVTSTPLDAPLPWRADAAPLHPRVQALARELGY